MSVSPLVIGIAGLVVLVVLVVLAIVSRFNVAGPNEAFIITGRRGKTSQDLSGQKVVTGSGVFVVPFVQSLSKLDLSSRRITVNIRGAVMACKHALPIMRAQKSGVILMISSISAWENYPNVAYKVTKAGMIAFTQQLAIRNAHYGIRANAILPGLMATPMAIDVRSRAINKPRDEIMRERDARVPLRGRQGTAWDVANAALFLASDEANFITGVSLPVDGGMLVDIAPGRLT